VQLTSEIRGFLENEIEFYSKRLKLKTPLSLFTDLELSGMVTTYKQFEYIKKETVGESWHHKDTGLDYDVMYINIENTDFLWQLIDAVVHELLHLKHPKLRHGSKFQDTVNKIIIGT
jgi:hypothetical protein